MKKARKFSNLKKSVKDFINDEEGFITKENILKVGLGAVSALGVLSTLTNMAAAAHTNHTSHNNVNGLIQQWIAGTQCYRIAATHTSAVPHVNHSSY